MSAQGAPSGVVRYRAKDVIPKILDSADSDSKLQIAGFMATIKKLEGMSCNALHPKCLPRASAVGHPTTPGGCGIALLV